MSIYSFLDFIEDFGDFVDIVGNKLIMNFGFRIYACFRFELLELYLEQIFNDF